MPSPPYKLTQQNPQVQISVAFSSSWVFIDNPTGSPIFVRLGGTDFPTVGSADIIVPASSTEVIPTTARDFAFTFQNPVSVGLTTVYVAATIMVGMLGEVSPQFGTIQQLASPFIEDRSAFLSIPIACSMQIIQNQVTGLQPLVNNTLLNTTDRKVGMFENYATLLSHVHFHAHVDTPDATTPVWVEIQLFATTQTLADGVIVNSSGSIADIWINTATKDRVDLVLPNMYLQRQIPDANGNVNMGYLSIYNPRNNQIPSGSPAIIKTTASALASQVP